MMFCRECGCQLPDESAFCTNCGTPVGPEQQSFANTVPEPAAPAQQVYANAVPEPAASVQQVYANAVSEPAAPVQQAYANAVPDMNGMQQYPAGAASPVFGEAAYGQASYGQTAYGQTAYGQAAYGQAAYGQTPEAYGFAGGQKPAMDKKRVTLEILFSALLGAVILPAVFFLLLWLLSRPWSVDFLRSVQRIDEMPSVLLFALICGFSAMLSILPKVITIMVRYKDPNDPAYKIGAEPGAVTGAKAERKYSQLASMITYLVIVLTFIFAGCVIYFLAGLPDAPDDTRDPSRTPDPSSSASSPKDDSRSSSGTSGPDGSGSSDRFGLPGFPGFGPSDSSGTPDAPGGLTATGDIGRTFDTMFFDYTVVSAESPAEYSGYTAESGKKLLVVVVKVKNDFGSTLPMYDTDFQIQWGTGDEDYAWAVDAFNNDMMPLEWELADGDEVTWDMLFEVPAGQYDFSLCYLEEYTDRDGNDQTGDFYSADFTLPAATFAS